MGLRRVRHEWVTEHSLAATMALNHYPHLLNFHVFVEWMKNDWSLFSSPSQYVQNQNSSLPTASFSLHLTSLSCPSRVSEKPGVWLSPFSPLTPFSLSSGLDVLFCLENMYQIVSFLSILRLLLSYSGPQPFRLDKHSSFQTSFPDFTALLPWGLRVSMRFYLILTTIHKLNIIIHTLQMRDWEQNSGSNRICLVQRTLPSSKRLVL